MTGNGAVEGWIDEDDIDGGRTTLLSPLIDLSGTTEPVLRFYRWFTNDASWTGESPDEDALVLHVSNDDGQTWATADSLTVTSNFHLHYARPGSATFLYAGQRRDRLRRGDAPGEFRILAREVVLDMSDIEFPAVGLFF